MKKEIRTLTGTIELRKDSEIEDNYIIVGYAAKFNSYSSEIGGFREIIDIGAFDNVLNCDVRALYNHDENMVLGRSSAGTLKLSVDEVGLKYEIIPPDTKYANDLIELLKRGDIKESSFAFSMKNGVEKWDDTTPITRHLVSIGELYDVSPVTYPAYPDSTSGLTVRSLSEIYDEYKLNNEKDVPEKQLNNIEILRNKLTLKVKQYNMEETK